jgi:hypothetical protein
VIMARERIVARGTPRAIADGRHALEVGADRDARDSPAGPRCAPVAFHEICAWAQPPAGPW